MAEPPSSPPTGDTSSEDALAWYKSQYEQLELELADFRESSKELEGELEKDLDAADKRERSLQGKAEALGFEVEEWKAKYRESKAEANAAQNTLEKEVTSLRDTSRTLQLKLRDIEVANDDYARQARNTTSSLDDLESKYNVAIERGVMLEEEIRIGEQERENLRIESQRLKDELSDLKVEAEILQGKVKKMEEDNRIRDEEQNDPHHLSVISTDLSMLESPTFDRSPVSTASSPLITTPPDSKPPTVSGETQDPPSPPMSDASAPAPPASSLLSAKPKGTPFRTPIMPKKSRLPSADHSVTPKPSKFATSVGRPPGTRAATAGPSVRTPAPRTSTAPQPKRATSHKVPQSTSLTHIRSLTAQMQRLEARVQSARSRLPAPVNTPPSRISPRSSVTVPSTVTIRSRKRTGTSSAASSVTANDDVTPTNHNRTGVPNSFSSSTSSRSHVPRLSTSGVSRLSFGPLPNRNPLDGSESRPSSRASVSSYQIPRPSSRAATERDSKEIMPPPRPVSRASLGGARTPLGIRPRSSMGGSLHGHSASLSGYHNPLPTPDLDDSFDASEMRTPSRRGTYSRYDAGGDMSSSTSGIPMPSSVRRQSGGIPVPSAGGPGRRTSGGPSGPTLQRRASILEDLGETY